MRRLTLLVSIILFLAAAASAGAEDYPKLADCYDPVLQENLEACIATLGLEGSAERGQICLALVDITDPEHPRLAGINDQKMMYAASLPKIAILLGAFDRIDKGELQLTPDTRKLLTQMIRYSSNSAATLMLNRVGKGYLADLLESPRYRLYDPEEHGGLWVGKDYGKAGAWKRDPIAHLSHGANALQVARFYYLLETGRLVSPEASRSMKEILGQPAIHHKFVLGLAPEGNEVQIFRKSGTWRDYHADSALIEHGDRKYIAVALAKNANGSKWLSSLIVQLDDLICRIPPLAKDARPQ